MPTLTTVLATCYLLHRDEALHQPHAMLTAPTALTALTVLTMAILTMAIPTMAALHQLPPQERRLPAVEVLHV